MDSTRPLYRQFSRQYFLLALSFLLLFLVGFSLYFQHQKDLTLIKQQQFPAIEKFNQRQLLLIQHHRLLNKVISSNSAAQFADDFQALNENIKNIALLSQNRKPLFEQLARRLQLQAENVRRLTDSGQRNIQLKDSVIMDMTIVADSLSQIIATQSQQEKNLYRKINQDSLADSVTAIRAKALSKLINNLNRNRELQQSLMGSLVMFKKLDLQYDLIDFDYLQQNTQKQIKAWLTNTSPMANKSVDDQALFKQTSALNALLFSEQSTFAKWRGQLNRVNDFQEELAKQKSELTPLLEQALVVQSVKFSTIEQRLNTWLAKVNISMPVKYTIWLVIGFFAVLVITFICALFSIRRKIKHFGLQSTAAVAELLSKGELLAPSSTLEMTEIINNIKQLTRPIHSEADFQHQQQQHQAQTDIMSRHSGHVFWQLPVLSKPTQQQLCALLGVELGKQHWRHYFNANDVRTILLTARQAKKNNAVERITITSQQKKSMALTLEYVDGAWLGSLCNAEEHRALSDENKHLQQQLQQQNQADKLSTIARSEYATAMVSSAMVQQQLLSLAGANKHLGYQQLQQLFCWSAQQKQRAQLRQNDFVLTLSTVNIGDEINTALANVSVAQVENNNAIYVNLAENLSPIVTLESELFQAMITVIAEKMLSEQQGAELNIKLQVIDVNSAQQIVRVSFQVNQPSCVDILSQVLNELVADNENANDCAHHLDNYLRDLQLVFNVSNKGNQPLEARQFSFELPLAIAENRNQPSKNKSIKLKECTLLVLATDKNSAERICQPLKNSKAVLETMQDMSLFQRQISIKHLTKKRLDVIVVSPEVYVSDYDLISQHLATLPDKVRPKVLVIQPFNSRVLRRTGLFSVSNLPWFSTEIMTSVAQLLSSANSNNILVAAEIFTPYRFEPTQVEVLLALATPNKNQTLLRILQWLGLQVTVVSQSTCLERLWQSGRYLVLISEFFPATLAITDQLKNVRGVFAINQNGRAEQELFEALALPKSWHTGYLAPVLDIQKLSQQLSPWLKSALSESERNKALVVRKQPSRSKSHKNVTNTNKHKSTKVAARLAPKANTEIVEQAEDIGLKQPSSSLEEVFDLAKFAENQGSAELAALMLDDYIAEINTSVSAVDYALQEQDYHLALPPLKSLIARAKILSAEALLSQATALNVALNNNSDTEVLSLQDKEQLQQQLNHLKLCLVQLTEFAESI